MMSVTTVEVDDTVRKMAHLTPASLPELRVDPS